MNARTKPHTPIPLEAQFEASLRRNVAARDELMTQRAAYEHSCAAGCRCRAILLDIRKHSDLPLFGRQGLIRKNIERAKFEGRS